MCLAAYAETVLWVQCETKKNESLDLQVECEEVSTEAPRSVEVHSEALRSQESIEFLV